MKNENLFEIEVAGLKNILGVIYVAVVKRSGILLNVVTDMVRVDIDHKNIAAMAATELAAAEELAKGLNLGLLKPIQIKTVLGNINIIDAGPKAFLLVITEAGMDDMVFPIALKKAAQEIERAADKMNLE